MYLDINRHDITKNKRKTHNHEKSNIFVTTILTFPARNRFRDHNYSNSLYSNGRI